MAFFHVFSTLSPLPQNIKAKFKKQKKGHCVPGERLCVRKISGHSVEKPKRSREKTDKKTAFADPLSACQAKFYFSK